MEINLPPRLLLLFKLGLVIATGVPVYRVWVQMIGASNQLEVVCNGVFLLIGLYFFGLLSAVLFSGSAAESVTDFLLYPARYLKKAPPVLSRQQGLITAGNFETAEAELMVCRGKNVSSPEIALMLAELHAEKMDDLNAAVTDCEFYFSHRKWRYHPLNLHIVLRYADWQQKNGNTRAALERVSRELKCRFYSAPDRKALGIRAQLLREQCSEE